MNHEQYMNIAIELAEKGMLQGQSPFGAVIVKDNQILAAEHNRVWKDTDITAHAEITAIRAACKKANTIDLAGSIIYSSTEPCPMCFAAIHWAKIEQIYYAASIPDAQNAGFNELTLSNKKIAKIANSPVKINPPILTEKAVQLFKKWKKSTQYKPY